MEEKSRDEIVEDNFFAYLEKENIKQKKYAEDNHLDPTLLTKWKKHKSNMSIEQVVNAANYLKIDITELLYEQDEYVSESAKLENEENQPKQFVTVYYVKGLFKSTLYLDSCLLIIYLIFGCINCTISLDNPFLYLGVSVIPFIFSFIIFIIFGSCKKKVSISIHDEVYYRIKSQNNPYYKIVVFLRILICIICFTFTIFLLLEKNPETTSFLFAQLFLNFFLFAISIHNVFLLAANKKKLPSIMDSIYSNQYTSSYWNFTLCLLMTLNGIMYLKNYHKLFPLYVSLILIIIILDFVIHFLYGKVFYKYQLVIKSHGVEKEFNVFHR